LIDNTYLLQYDNALAGKLQHWTSSTVAMPTDCLIDYTHLVYR
jgi:hypothetical protein